MDITRKQPACPCKWYVPVVTERSHKAMGALRRYSNNAAELFSAVCTDCRQVAEISVEVNMLLAGECRLMQAHHSVQTRELIKQMFVMVR